MKQTVENLTLQGAIEAAASGNQDAREALIEVGESLSELVKALEGTPVYQSWLALNKDSDFQALEEHIRKSAEDRDPYYRALSKDDIEHLSLNDIERKLRRAKEEKKRAPSPPELDNEMEQPSDEDTNRATRLAESLEKLGLFVVPKAGQLTYYYRLYQGVPFVLNATREEFGAWLEDKTSMLPHRSFPVGRRVQMQRASITRRMNGQPAAAVISGLHVTPTESGDVVHDIGPVITFKLQPFGGGRLKVIAKCNQLAHVGDYYVELLKDIAEDYDKAREAINGHITPTQDVAVQRADAVAEGERPEKEPQSAKHEKQPLPELSRTDIERRQDLVFKHHKLKLYQIVQKLEEEDDIETTEATVKKDLKELREQKRIEPKRRPSKSSTPKLS